MNITIKLYRKITSVKTWRDTLLCILFYSILWLLLTSIVLTIFHRENRTLLWAVDGLYQHYPAFNHLCSYVESLLNNEPVSWFNLGIGPGLDVLTTLNCYDFTDPVSIIAALFVPLSRSVRYELMIILKLYLIGISFFVFCRSIGRDNGIYIISGALAYTFSGNVLITLTRHPNFINWAYFFPLILAGAELYRRRKKPGLFVISVFLNILTNYYTYYINVVLLIAYLFIYAISELITSREKGQLLNTFKFFINLILYGTVGVFLSMFSMLPTIYAYLSNTRVMQRTGYLDSLFRYEISYYLTFFSNICSFSEGPHLAVTGMNAVSFTALIMFLLILHKQRNNLKYKFKRTFYPMLFIILLLFLCMPIAGSVFNGFGYATNRWSYALFFFSSIVLVELLSFFSDMDKRSCIFSLIIITAYVFIVYFFLNGNETHITSMGLITLILLAFLMMITFRLGKKYKGIIILFLTVIGCVFQILFLYDTSYHAFVKEHISVDELVYREADSSFDSVLTDDPTFFRTAKTSLIPSQNQEVLEERHGISLYWSIIPKWVYEYYFTFELPDMINPCNVGGVDSRTALMELVGVKYFFKPDNIEAPIPFGYKKIAEKPNEDKNELYENEYSLPIGYFYDACILPEEFWGMNPVDKQQAMMEGIFVDSIPENMRMLDYKSAIKDISYKIKNINDVELTDDMIKSKETGGNITLETDIPSGCEIYLWIDGVKLSGDKGICSINVSRMLNNKIITQSHAPIHNQHFAWPIIRDGIIYNLGYGNEGINEINIIFSSTDPISYKSIRILAVPMSDYSEKADKLKNSGLKDVLIEADRVSGQINVSSSGFLQFSIPYSIGWSAYDNGVKMELIRSNIMYMALPLEEGEHFIELEYHIPYFKQGLFISLATVIIFFLIQVFKFFRRNI
ncbi:MAG: YfhO family protein [Lachnospiraceae bacterium]|nr:YfhO family protein [Lachnospiraceae bacterium]